jgi:hypothetical protein
MEFVTDLISDCEVHEATGNKPSHHSIPLQGDIKCWGELII